MAFTAAQLAAVRENGKKGGRPPGPSGPLPRTIRRRHILEQAKKRIDEAIARKALELIDAQMRIGLQTDSYAAANSAIESLLDRAFGRATPILPADQAPRAPVTIVHVYAAGTEPTPVPDVHVLPAKE